MTAHVMDQHPIGHLPAILVGAAGVIAVSPVPELAFVAQFTAVGAFGGYTVGVYKDHRLGTDDLRRGRIVGRWTWAGTVAGIAVYLLSRLASVA